MANFKSIADVPVAESAEGLNLIVNDGGTAKQIPAGQVGAQADWSVIDSSDPAFIKNKPEIPEQVQADWNVTDVSNPAFIMNKPAGGYVMEVGVDECRFNGDNLDIKKDYFEIVDSVNSGVSVWIKVPSSVFGDSYSDFIYFSLASCAVVTYDGETMMYAACVDCMQLRNIGIAISSSISLE